MTLQPRMDFWAYLGVLVGLANLIDYKFLLCYCSFFFVFFDGGLCYRKGFMDTVIFILVINLHHANACVKI